MSLLRLVITSDTDMEQSYTEDLVQTLRPRLDMDGFRFCPDIWIELFCICQPVLTGL